MHNVRMTVMRGGVAALALALFFVLAPGAAEAKDGPWSEMDYGPFMTITLESPHPRGNFAYKGVIVPLNDERTANMVFDTDLLRWSAGWTGGFISWTNIQHDGSHGSHNRIEGEQVFGTAVQPGWAKPGTHDAFDDPRMLPFGPLPKDWAQWKGLYLHGEQVVLSYRIGTTDVLEQPGLVEQGGVKYLTRTLQFGSRAKPLAAAVSDTGDVQVVIDPNSPAKLDRDGDRVRLVVPAGADPITVRLVIAKGGGDVVEAAMTLPWWKEKVDLEALTKGGPKRWQPLETTGTIGPDRGPFAVDEIKSPEGKGAPPRIRPGGFDFYPGADKAAVCTWDGDVWIVEGIAGDLKKVTWTRYATGLFQPLGLVVDKGEIYVLGRDQITRLHDLNNDGEADWYEAFNHDAQVTEHFHEFAMDLQLGPDGDFYYMKGACHARDARVPQHGTLLRVKRDGSETKIVCGGFRAPNGLGISEDGRFATTDQQGHWTPGNRVNIIEPGKFYGYMQAWLPKDKPKPTKYDGPICFLHPSFDRSPAAPVWVDSKQWGPLDGKLLVLSYGTGEIELIMDQQVGGEWQGAAVKLPIPPSATGIMRGRFSPKDGQLYACGLFGWSSNRTRPGGFYRIRYTDKPMNLPIDIRFVRGGIVLTFSDKLDKELAEDPASYAVAMWNYPWHAPYKTRDLKVSDGSHGRDKLDVKNAKLASDGRTVMLAIDELKPAMQVQIKYDLESAEGAVMRSEIQGTIHELASPTSARAN